MSTRFDRSSVGFEQPLLSQLFRPHLRLWELGYFAIHHGLLVLRVVLRRRKTHLYNKPPSTIKCEGIHFDGSLAWATD